MAKSNSSIFLFVAISILLLFPTLILGECTCKVEEEESNKSSSLKYKLVAIASILTASAIGVCIPMLGKVLPALSPERDFFFIIKAFAAGVILSTGFIHVLPDATEKLTSPCLNRNPWGDFPFTGFIAMLAAIGTLMVDTYATSFYSRRSNVKAEANGGGEGGGMVHVHTHGHAHGAVAAENGGETELLRHRVISQSTEAVSFDYFNYLKKKRGYNIQTYGTVLELGIIVHSVIIGIALGVSESPSKIKPLIAALTFHQFFEGMGLGGCIMQAKFKWKAVTIMAIFFSLTTPIGIVVGIGISNIYSETSPTALIVEGVFNSASAGILIYMALVDLLAADFMSHKMQNNGKLQLGANLALLLGAGCMSLLAKWA